MVNQFHAIFEQDGDWVVAYCPEIPGANGMGRTKDECREDLANAIRLILQDRYEDATKN
jgi:predicted RNase H-like HicB family nuclease